MTSPPASQPSTRANWLILAATRGVLGAWLWLVLLWIALVSLEGSQIASMWELQTGTLGLLPAWLLVFAPAGVLGGIAGALLEPNPERGAPTRLRSRSILCAGVALFGFGIAWGVGGGRHLANLESRGGFALVVTLLAGASCFLGTKICRRVLLHTHGRMLVLAGFGATALFAELANNLLLVRLYPAFHLGLSVLAGALAGAIFQLASPARAPSRPSFKRVFPWLALLLAAVVLVPASRVVSGFDNFRWMVTENSATLGFGVEAAAMLAPPPPLDKDLSALPLGSHRPTGDVDFRGRDIVLISIDALRADHLGAYGYDRPTSPAIDALAKEGVTFEASYAPTPHTSYSISSLMTGKYMRPLLLQGAGEDSELWAGLLQTYDYRTAGFYPPAVFFIDTPRFEQFKQKELGFEYAKVEFAEGPKRQGQIQGYLKTVPKDRRVFLWAHLFGPHEPYEQHPDYNFGTRDIDLYDSEIRAADESVRAIVAMARERDPHVLIILTADHGEEFGDHGGRYHGTSVFDEQVRVPLILAGAGLPEGRRIKEPVQTIDLLPTVLSGLRIPIPPRVRGRDLSALLAKKPAEAGAGRAVAETDDYTLLAENNLRLICQRRSGACQLYDVAADPKQERDIANKQLEAADRMRTTARSIAETHGQYESQGLRAQGKGWPTAILLGISGNAEIAPALAQLLDDADVTIRRKAAELLFDLAQPGQAASLRLAMTREEDSDARAWIALTLTRLGQGAPLVFELLSGAQPQLKRMAALALAEQGNDAGEMVLVSWWISKEPPDFAMSLKVLDALASIKSKKAVPFLISSLDSVRLRPYIARTLAAIGDKDAKPHLAAYLNKERYHSARAMLAEALVDLGADDELIVPLRRFLGVPDRMNGGLDLALRAGILADVGGPKDADRKLLAQLSDSGVKVSMVVPPGGEKGSAVRLVIRARTRSGAEATVLVQPSAPRIPLKKGEVRARNQPAFDESAFRMIIPARESTPQVSHEVPWTEIASSLPAEFGAQAGHHLALEVFAPSDVEISAIAAVPLRQDLPPPPPEPWKADQSVKQ